MSPVKEALRETIEHLSDEDAARLLEMARQLHDREAVQQVLQRLADDQTFLVPEDSSEGYAKFEPAPVAGEPASDLLVRDRR